MTQDLKVPKLRFSEFSGEWKERKIGDVVEVNPKSVIPESFEYVDLESVLGTELLSHRTEFKSTAPSRAQRVARSGDVFYQTVRPYQKNNYLFTLNDANYVFSTGYAQLRPQIDSHFLFAYLQNEHFVNKVLEKCTGTGYPAINCSDLSQISIGIPNSEERQKIGSFFANLDSTITHQQRKLESIKKLKKGLLQKMFPRKGQSVPELRFHGFSGKWEERMLGDIAEYKKGFAFKSEDYISEGIKIIRVSDLDKNSIKTSGHVCISSEKAKIYEQWKLKENDLIITTVGSKPPVWDSLVGKVIYVSKEFEGSLLNQNAIRIRAKNANAQTFIRYIFTKQYIDYIRTIIRGNANQGSITVEELFKYSFKICPLQEQQKIGSFFADLDKSITHQQHKLDSLKKLKKGLLQQMFV